MKKYFIVLLLIIFAVLSCQKDEELQPIISIDQTEIPMPNLGGKKTIPFESNVNWTAESSVDWCIVFPLNGDASTKGTTIFLSPNNTYSDRSCTVTIMNGSIPRIITINQSRENTINFTNDNKNISGHSQTLEVALRTNVDFEVIIPTAAKKWISYTGNARSLLDETLLLNITENKSYALRTAKINIKDKNTNLQRTFTINQHSKGNEVLVEKMGTLTSILSEVQKDTITTIRIKGEINKADFEVMKSEMPNLRYVDLKDVKCEDDKIPSSAFGDFHHRNSNKNIAGVILPLNIRTIDLRAFCYSEGLTSLNIPPDVTEIGDYAFYICKNLKGSLIIPGKISKIGTAAFQSCDFTGALNLPDGLTSIEKNAFSNCTGFTELVFGKNITTIGETAFKNCSNISGNVIFPENLNSIGEGAFEGCKKVLSFQFPHTTPIPYRANMLHDRSFLIIPLSAVEAYGSADGWKNHNILW